jgi:hypothetical protein
MSRAPRPSPWLAGWAAFACAVAYFGVSAGMGVTRLEFGDETEKFVAALMQREGGRLYRDVFTQHGPLSYVIPHAMVAVLGGDLGLRATRVAVALVTLGAGAAIAWSPAFTRPASRALAAAAFLGALAPLWLLQSLNLGLYHNLAGCLSVVVLSQLTVPAILGVRVGRGAAFASGLAAGLVPFAAYSHGPAMVLFALAALVGARAGTAPEGELARSAGAFAAGAILAATLVLGWLALFGDVGGFFVYSFVFNQRIYGRFIGFDWTLPLESVAPRLAPELAVRAFSVVAAALGLGAIAWRGARGRGGGYRLVALAILAAGILMLNPRGGFGFAANALVVASIGVAALGAGALAEGAAARAARARPLFAAAVATCLVAGSEAVSWAAVSSAPNFHRREELTRQRAIFKWPRAPREDLIRSMADPSERIHALIYRPHLYIEAGRLPAAAQYYFLPWQAEYERDPVAGYELDLCRDLRDAAPPVVFFDDWLVWERYRFAEYAPCIARLIEERYTPVAQDPQVRIRNDRLVERWRPTLGLVPATRAAREALGSRLPGLTPLEVEVAGSPGACLTLPEPGARLAIADCELPGSRWQALDSGGGSVVLIGGDGMLCLDVVEASLATGAAAHGSSCSGAPSQLVTVVRGRDGDAIQLRHSGLCLGPSASGGVEQGVCAGDRGPWKVKASTANGAAAIR